MPILHYSTLNREILGNNRA